MVAVAVAAAAAAGAVAVVVVVVVVAAAVLAGFRADTLRLSATISVAFLHPNETSSDRPRYSTPP